MLNKVFIDDINIETKERFIVEISKRCSHLNIYSDWQQAQNEFIKRESLGNTLISPNIALPHLESTQVLQSCVLFVKLQNMPILWEGELIKMVIVICLKKAELDSVKYELRSIMRVLANEQKERKILLCESLEAINEIIN